MTNRLLRHWRLKLVYIGVLGIAVALYFLSTEPVFHSTTRFKIIMVAILAQSVGLAFLTAKLYDLLAELRSQHRAASYVAAVRGLWMSLEAGLEHPDGLPIETRRAIYAAGEEQFDLYDRVLGRTTNVSTGTAVRRTGVFERTAMPAEPSREGRTAG